MDEAETHTDFDRSEHKAYMARLWAEEQLREHQPFVGVVNRGVPLQVREFTPEWLELDRLLEAQAREAYDEWERTRAENPRHAR